MRFKKILSALTAGCIAAAGSVFGTFGSASAADVIYKFDLGANAQSGYTSVSASQAYSSSTGYGFSGSGVSNVSASGSGALSDAVRFTDNTTTFNVDLPKGLYRISVTLGDTNRTSVYIENMLQIVNMTQNNAYDSIVIPVTDGQLNIRAAAGRAGYAYTISEVDIEKISDNPEAPNTVWMCGDSTVCNYYPLDTSVQAGWGQVLNKFIDTSVWQVRDMAASGQYAKGFIEAGQFDAIEYYGKKGDIFIVSIGINDTNYSNAEEYYAAVTDMVTRAKAKEMTVYLVKQQGRATDVTNNPNLKGRWFGGTLDQIGQEQNVPVIDLFNLFFDYCKSIGQEATTALYMTNDTLHPNRQGAMILAEMAAKQIDWEAAQNGKPLYAEIDTTKSYLIKNKNSGLYLTVEGDMVSGANAAQGAANVSGANVWNFHAAEDGYYTMTPSGNPEIFLDVTGEKTTSGTNIGMYREMGHNAQLFRLVDNGDGSYLITTKVTGGASCIEVKDALTEIGANVQQWEKNGHPCQSWILEPVKLGMQSAENVILGDVNHDGKVNCFDFVLIKRNAGAISGGDRHYADTNSDGFVDVSDINAIGKFLTKQGNFDAVEKKSAFYYADEMTFSKGVTENTNAGFKKENYVNLDNCVGSFIEWNINVPESGEYKCIFSNANGSTASRSVRFEINGENISTTDFESTGGWDKWNQTEIVLTLEKGKNIIRMTSESEQGAPNIDYLYLEKMGAGEDKIPDENTEPTENTQPTEDTSESETEETV